MAIRTASQSAMAADLASWYCAIVLVALIVLSAFSDTTPLMVEEEEAVRGSPLLKNNKRPCDEIYVVGEGETLHTISDRCGDPFIVEQNPHIHDPDDVFPGLVIKITPLSSR